MFPSYVDINRHLNLSIGQPNGKPPKALMSISGHRECPEMDTLFYAIIDYQRVTDLARFWHSIRYNIIRN